MKEDAGLLSQSLDQIRRPIQTIQPVGPSEPHIAAAAFAMSPVIGHQEMETHALIEGRKGSKGGDAIPPVPMDAQGNPAAGLLEQKTEGSGLGLAISKGIIELHGGKITAVSVPAAGTTFFIEFLRS